MTILSQLLRLAFLMLTYPYQYIMLAKRSKMINFVTIFGNFGYHGIFAMPTLHIINSIKIDVYSRDHLPPHFHAIYAEHEMLIEIESLKKYAGYLPVRQHKMVLSWAKDKKVKEYLLLNFKRLNPYIRG